MIRVAVERSTIGRGEEIMKEALVEAGVEVVVLTLAGVGGDRQDHV